jgi:ATP-dependent protease ClpP protease subunit
MAVKRPALDQRSALAYITHEFNVNTDTRDIFLHGYIDYEIPPMEEPGVDYRMAANLIKNLNMLRHLDSEAPILIHMMTCGGDWNFGMAIYDAIKACANPVVVLAYAHSRSMSSIIPQAADYRVIMPNADFLIHWGSSGYEGNYTSVQAEAEWDKVLSERMLDIYAERCQDGDFWKRRNLLHTKDIREWLRENMDKRQEYYMDARESVDKGFFDAVLGDENYETIESLRTV